MRGITGIVFLLIAGFAANLYAEEALIRVYPDKITGQVNKNVFGNNLIAYDPSTYEGWGKDYSGYSDYGAGIWDPVKRIPHAESVYLAKAAGISMLRFPGGCGVHLYDWKKAIGDKREHFLFGIDEFFAVCAEIDAEPVMTVSFFKGEAQDAADLVAYLNLPEGAGDNPWVTKRKQNGHPAAYNVKYFEIGNEDWHGDHNDIKEVSPSEYAKRYLSYFDAMKAVDPSILIGAILCPDLPGWDEAVLGRVKGKIDFAVVHTYPAPTIDMLKLLFMGQKDIFKTSLAVPVLKDEPYFQRLDTMAQKYCNKRVPVAVTEYNGGFNQDKPVPYRHSLGTALINAELIRIFMKPSNNILMANYWQFNNSYWGMIANGFDGTAETLDLTYFKRPNFYVYEMYESFFQDVLIEAQAEGPTYSVKPAPGSLVPYLSVNASVDEGATKVCLMVVNKHMEKSIKTKIQFEHFVPGAIDLWVLNGAEVASTNEVNHAAVGMARGSSLCEGQACAVTFQPHSLTAVVIERKK